MIFKTFIIGMVLDRVVPIHGVQGRHREEE